MSRRHNKKVILAVSVLTVGALVGGAAYAFRFGKMANRIYAHVKKELALNAQQEKQVDAIKDRVVAHFKSKKRGYKGLIGEAKKLWLADKYDEAGVRNLIGKIQARRTQHIDIIAAALKDLHGVLQADQRQKLVSMLEKFRHKMKKRWRRHH